MHLPSLEREQKLFQKEWKSVSIWKKLVITSIRFEYVMTENSGKKFAASFGQEGRASVSLQNKKEWLVFFFKGRLCRRFEIYFESPFRKKSFKNVGVEFCFLTGNKKIFVLLVRLYAHGVFFGDD